MIGDGRVIAARIAAVARLRQRLMDAPFGCGRPFWIDDPCFAVDDHVRPVACAVPGDEEALLAVVAETVTTRLPRDHPLWSATLVTGLAAGRSALVVVFHHVLTDGLGGLAVLAHLVDVDRLVVSARRQADATHLGNQVGVVRVMLSTTGEPMRRLAAVARVTRRRRTVAPGSSAALIGPVFRMLAKAGVYGWLVDRQRLVNTFVSDLHGPDHRLSFLGAPVVDVVAVSGISGNVTVAFVALSYAGRLTVTVIADPQRCPDFDDVAAAVDQELQVLTSSSRMP